MFSEKLKKTQEKVRNVVRSSVCSFVHSFIFSKLVTTTLMSHFACNIRCPECRAVCHIQAEDAAMNIMIKACDIYISTSTCTIILYSNATISLLLLLLLLLLFKIVSANGSKHESISICGKGG